MRVTDAVETGPPLRAARYLTELGQQQILLGELSNAERSFHSAVERDETDVLALYGIIHRRIQEGNLEDAEEQLEFLNEIQVSVGKSPDLAFLHMRDEYAETDELRREGLQEVQPWCLRRERRAAGRLCHLATPEHAAHRGHLPGVFR